MEFLDAQLYGCITSNDLVKAYKTDYNKDLEYASEFSSDKLNLVGYSQGTGKAINNAMSIKVSVRDVVFRLCMGAKVDRNLKLLDKKFNSIKQDIIVSENTVIKCLKRNYSFINPFLIDINNFKLFCILHHELSGIKVDDEFLNINKDKYREITIFKYPEGYKLPLDIESLINKCFPATSLNTGSFSFNNVIRHFLLDSCMTYSECNRYTFLLFFDILTSPEYKGIKVNLCKSQEDIEKAYKFATSMYTNILDVAKAKTDKKLVFNKLYDFLKSNCKDFEACDMTENQFLRRQLELQYNVKISKEDLKFQSVGLYYTMCEETKDSSYIGALNYLGDLLGIGVKEPINLVNNLNSRLTFNSCSLILSLLNLGIADISYTNKNLLLSVLVANYYHLKDKSLEEVNEFMQTYGLIEYILCDIGFKYKDTFENNCIEYLNEVKSNKAILDENEKLKAMVEELKQDKLKLNQTINVLKVNDDSYIKATQELRKEFREVMKDKDSTIKALTLEVDRLKVKLETEKVEPYSTENQEVSIDSTDYTHYKILVIGNDMHKLALKELEGYFDVVDFLDGNNPNLSINKDYFSKYDLVLKQWEYVGHVSSKYEDLARLVTKTGYLDGTNREQWLTQIKTKLKDK